jgi:hypothetical protein
METAMPGPSRESTATAAVPRRFFSVAEANRALPYIARVVADVVALFRDARDLQRLIRTASPGDAVEALRDRLVEAFERSNACVEELQAAGVELADYQAGIVDFPSLLEGREVRLCWRLGESGVDHWHEPGEGHVSRRRIGLAPMDVAR